jgi:hypothetical protein
MADEGSKRQRPNGEPEASGSQAQAAWPSAADLYAEGLTRRAEAETRSSSWAMDARQLRASAFSAADKDGSGLRQRQLDMRKQLLRKPTAG